MRPVRGLYEKHFNFKMLITFEPNVAQRSVASQNDHKSKACLPEASNTAFTMYRRLRRLYEAPFLAPFFWRLTALINILIKLIHCDVKEARPLFVEGGQMGSTTVRLYVISNVFETTKKDKNHF